MIFPSNILYQCVPQKLAEEQQKNQEDLYATRSRRRAGRGEGPTDSLEKQARLSVIYEMRQDIDLGNGINRDREIIQESGSVEKTTGSTGEIAQTPFELNQGNDDSLKELVDFDENATYDHDNLELMIIGDFRAHYLDEIYKLDYQFDPSYASTRREMNAGRLLDLVISKQTGTEYKRPLVCKIWMNDLMSAVKEEGAFSSYGNQVHQTIIQKIHYGRCSEFIFLHSVGDSERSQGELQAMRLCYEKIIELKKESGVFHVQFLGVTPEYTQRITVNRQSPKNQSSDLLQYSQEKRVTKLEYLQATIKDILRTSFEKKCARLANQTNSMLPLRRGQFDISQLESKPNYITCQSSSLNRLVEEKSSIEVQFDVSIESKKVQLNEKLDKKKSQFEEQNMQLQHGNKCIELERQVDESKSSKSVGKYLTATTTNDQIWKQLPSISPKLIENIKHFSSNYGKHKGSKSQDLRTEKFIVKVPRSLSYHLYQHDPAFASYYEPLSRIHEDFSPQSQV